VPQAWPPSNAARSVVQNQNPTDHCGQGHQNSHVNELPATPTPVPPVPIIIVNGSNLVR
jgi:hypothetical protein